MKEKSFAQVFGVLIALLCACPAFAPSAAFAADDTGIWETRYYIDEFGLPTEDSYISTKEAITGTFENSATTGSALSVWFFIDTDANIVQIRLLEYGNQQVKNANSRDRIYDISMMDGEGNRYKYTGKIPAQSKDIVVDDEGSTAIISALNKGGTVRFVLTDTEQRLNKYSFVIDDAAGFVHLSINAQWDYIGSFIDGFARVEKNGKWGFIDTTGQLVTSCEWDYVSSFIDGFARVEKNGKWGFIDTTGQLVIPCEWDGVGNFIKGFAWVKKDGRYGYIDTTGQLIIPCEWDSVGSFREGLASVKKDGKWYTINPAGEIVQ